MVWHRRCQRCAGVCSLSEPLLSLHAPLLHGIFRGFFRFFLLFTKLASRPVALCTTSVWVFGSFSTLRSLLERWSGLFASFGRQFVLLRSFASGPTASVVVCRSLVEIDIDRDDVADVMHCTCRCVVKSHSCSVFISFFGQLYALSTL